MGIAKSAPSETLTPQVTQPPIKQEGLLGNYAISGVPIDVFNYFSTPLNSEEKEVNKLKDIYNWAKEESGDGTLGDILLKIRNLETHLGSPSGLDRRYDKLYQYCKMTMHQREIEKRKEALRRKF